MIIVNETSIFPCGVRNPFLTLPFMGQERVPDTAYTNNIVNPGIMNQDGASFCDISIQRAEE